jgi:hypothetical protein
MKIVNQAATDKTSASASINNNNIDKNNNNNNNNNENNKNDQLNNHLNLYSSNQWWGDHFLLQLKDMLCETCRHRHVSDCDFFINKRDYPQLKYNTEQLDQPVEPYGFIFNEDDRDPRQDRPLSRECYATYAPIL